MYPLEIDEKYDQSNLDNLVHRFTTLYLGNYLPGDMREGVGSHPGVDIVPVRENDDVFCVLDGEVMKSEEDSVSGKHIIIKHSGVKDPDDFSKTTNLYSCYLHLSDISVSVGDNINEGKIIGKTGNTGMSFGEHLHFQIDREESPFHVYWPFTSAEASAAGGSFTDGVNSGLGLDKAREFTVNPLVYLDKLENDNTIGGETLNPKSVTGDDEPFFNDIDSSHPYFAYLNKLGNDGIIDGNNGYFLPKDNITRAEILKMIFKINGTDISLDDADYFPDVSGWHKKYVNTGVNLGMITTSNSKYRPNDSVTRIEALKLILISKGVNLNDGEVSNYSDIPSNIWYEKYVNYSFKFDLIPVNGNNFEPNKAISREEVIGVFFKLED